VWFYKSDLPATLKQRGKTRPQKREDTLGLESGDAKLQIQRKCFFHKEYSCISHAYKTA